MSWVAFGDTRYDRPFTTIVISTGYSFTTRTVPVPVTAGAGLPGAPGIGFGMPGIVDPTPGAVPPPGGRCEIDLEELICDSSAATLSFSSRSCCTRPGS